MILPGILDWKIEKIVAPSSSLLNQILSYWKLNETTGNAIDSVDSNDGSIKGTVLRNQPGKINKSYYFDGSSNCYVDCSVKGTDTNLQFTTTGSLSTWYCPSTNLDYHTIVAKMNIRTDKYGYGIYVHDLDLVFEIGNSTTHTARTTSNALTRNVWNHVAMTWSPGVINGYINGVCSSTACSITPDYSITYPFTIGNDTDWSFGAKGWIDEVGAWNRCLTPTEVSTLYNNGLGLSYPFAGDSFILSDILGYWNLDETSGSALDSIGSNNWANTGGATQGSSGIINTGYQFNGTDDYLTVISSIAAGKRELTLSVWVNPDELVSTNGIWCELYPLGGNFWEYNISQGTWYTRTIKTGLTGARTNDLALPALTQNAWNHLVFVYSVSGNYKRIFLNGVQSATTSTDISTLISGSTILYVGRDYDGTYYDGYIDEIGAWNRALTPTEVSTLYNNGIGKSYPFT